MMRTSWRVGLAAGILGLLAPLPARAQVIGPPGAPPSVARAGTGIPPYEEVPADGTPRVCAPQVEVRTTNKRVYDSACYNVCYPKCTLSLFNRLGCGGCGGCGECGDCDAGGCHQCSKVYVKKYLVVRIRKEERCVDTCVPVPAPCEESCGSKWNIPGRKHDSCAQPCQQPCAPTPYVSPGPYYQAPPTMMMAPAH